jgi:hypothetical protein
MSSSVKIAGSNHPPMKSSRVQVATAPQPLAAARPAWCRHRPSRGEQVRWGLRGYRLSWHALVMPSEKPLENHQIMEKRKILEGS